MSGVGEISTQSLVRGCREGLIVKPSRSLASYDATNMVAQSDTQDSELKPRAVQWLVPVVNLTQSKIIREESLSEELCRLGWPVHMPWGLFSVGLAEEGRATLKLGSTFSWAGP